MGHDGSSGVSELAAAVARARVGGLVDVYLERRADVWWHLGRDGAPRREVLLREGAAVRRDGALTSTDGLERPLLARLLGVETRLLPRFSAPAFAAPPAAAEVLDRAPAAWTALRWSWRWAAVLAGGSAVAIRTPALAEITFRDGHRGVTVWPPRVEDGRPGPEEEATSRPRAGVPCLLLAPAAAAVLLHELVGHPLEGDALRRRPLPLSGAPGARVFDLPLSVSDDPTRADLPGSFSADDEGEAAVPRELVAGGAAVGALCDRESAAALGRAPGNARRAGVHVRPRPRISNLIASVPDALPQPPRAEAAIEVVSLSSGTLEPASGTIVLRVRTAFALRRGERSRRLAPFTLVGSFAAMRPGLLAAAEPSDACAEPGWCAKEGEVVPTGAVAPWLLLSGLEVR